MPDLESSKPETSESPEPSIAPSPLSNQAPRVSLEDMKQSHQMLLDFKEGVENSSFQGNDARSIALGLDFLGRMIEQSRQQIEWAKREEKDAFKRAKDAIKEAGGTINGEPATPAVAS